MTERERVFASRRGRACQQLAAQPIEARIQPRCTEEIPIDVAPAAPRGRRARRQQDALRRALRRVAEHRLENLRRAPRPPALQGGGGTDQHGVTNRRQLERTLRHLAHRRLPTGPRGTQHTPQQTSHIHLGLLLTLLVTTPRKPRNVQVGVRRESLLYLATPAGRGRRTRNREFSRRLRPSWR